MEPEWYWLIPAVVVASWIIRGLLRNQEEDAGKSPRLATPRADMAEERPARPANDVDRFLEEINRLRRKSAEARGEPARPVVAPPPIRRPTVRPAAREAPRPRPVTTIPEVIPARRAPEPSQRSVFQGVDVPVEAIPLGRPAPAPSAAPSSLIASLAPFIPTKMVDRGIAPSLTLLFALLNTRESLRSAFLLREVLDVPLCKRPRKRTGTYS